MSQDWNRFSNWHTLFDGLCRSRGYSDNAELASELCRHTGRSGERDFLAAEKNLRNWRLGKRIPLRRNAAVLFRLLDVGSDPDLRRRWEEAYRALHVSDEPYQETGPEKAVSGRLSRERGAPLRTLLMICAAVPVVVLAAAGWNGLTVSRTTQAEKAGLPTVAYNARAFLSVGAEKLIHGVVDECGGAPSQWADMVSGLPESKTGIFVDGGLATKMLNRCGEESIVRAVKFIAIRPGVEELQVLGAYFKIEVAASSTTSDE